MKITILLFVFVMAFIFLLEAGRSSNGTGMLVKPTPIYLTIPNGWPKPTINFFAGNPLTEEGFQLGRKLFYDGRLSKDGNFACASCHQQFAAFATYDHDLSHGFNNAFTTRNAPALFNLAWMTSFHWDGAINHIEVQPLAPMTAANEMAENIDSVLKKLRADKTYPQMFKAAFGSTDINSQRMLKSLAQFVGSLVSANSKYDKVQNGKATFTTAEQRGYDVFKANCAICHKEPLFTDNSFRNNGLAMSPFLKDVGRKHATGNSEDSLKFKVPTLRNIAYTFPYMHDGRIYSLGQVIEHYRTGIDTTQHTLDPLLKKRINISNKQKNDLIYFLYTLSDSAFVISPRYAQP